MAYVVPTYADFIARFPIFDDTDLYSQPVVEALIAEAASQIDNSWREQDYAPAIMYLAAHKLALDNSTSGGEIDIGGPTSLASESFAGMSMSYKKQDLVVGSAAASSFGVTAYGRSYYDLLRKNKPPVVVA